MNQVLIAIGALALGCVLRTLLPYVVSGFNKLKDNQPWPKFEYSYLGSLGLVVSGYLVAFLTVPDTFSGLMQMSFVEIVGFAYLSQESARQIIKFTYAIYKLSKQ